MTVYIDKRLERHLDRLIAMVGSAVDCIEKGGRVSPQTNRITIEYAKAIVQRFNTPEAKESVQSILVVFDFKDSI